MQKHKRFRISIPDFVVTQRLNVLANTPPADVVMGRVKRMRFKTVPPSQAQTVDELTMTDTERIKKRAAATGRPPDDVIVVSPPSSPQTEVLAQCSAFSWFVAGQRFVAGSEHYDYPVVIVLARVWLQHFMREPCTNKGERPCFNLDRDPLPNEGKMRCVWHRLGGFRLRELLFDSNQPSPTSIPELCYLCHLYTYLVESIAQRTNPRDTIYIINKFMVIINRPGEYAADKMLTDETGTAGIWGPVPIFNENNYVAGPVVDGLRTVRETDNLLFRLPRAPLQQIGLPALPPSAGRVSIRSSRTNAALPPTSTPPQ